MAVSRLAFVVLVLVILVIGFAVGFLAGYLGRQSQTSRPPYSTAGAGGGEGGRLCPPTTGGPPAIEVRMPANGGDQQQDQQHYGNYGHDHDRDNVRDQLMNGLSSDTIRNYLRDLTSGPRLAGTSADRATAVKMRDFWRDHGLDEAQIVPYNVLLSYPELSVHNRVELYDRRDKLIFSSETGSNRSGPQPPFSAYSATGSPKGSLVYVNYATVEDFLWLSNKANIDIRGKICIARYGKILQASKAENTERFGGAGLILFTDPDVVTGSTSTYPHSWWMPGNVAESGTLKMNHGDPLTPGYPSTVSAYRLPPASTDLPTIPVLPIGYDDVMHLLQLMVGPKAPEDWQGHLPVTYRLGPGFHQPDMKVQLKVSTTSENATVHNVVGVIHGSQEPDRYVVLSSHHDAWAYGAASSGSGTAIMMEISRVMGNLKKNGWRPRRSILFCSWAAGVYGQVGSTEWVEQYGRLLVDRAVAAISLDVAVQGNYTLRGRGMPMVQRLMFNVAKQVLNPDVSERSHGRARLYDTWIERGLTLKEDKSTMKKAILDAPDLSSGLGPFVSMLGISALDVGFIAKQHRGRTLYPLYHTQYDTYHMVENFIDRNFTYHVAIAQYTAELSRRLAEDVLLPFNVVDYVEVVEQAFKRFDTDHGQILKARGLTHGLEYISSAISTFRTTAEAFSQRVSRINISDPLAVRLVNDVFMSLDRAFIDPSGIPGMPFDRHVLFSPVSHDRPTDTNPRPAFPGLVGSLAEASRATVNSAGKWATVRRQLAIIAHFIDTAAALLRPVHRFF